MSKNFSLVDIVSEADTFTDTDGTRYEVRSIDDFGAYERSRIRKFQRELQATEKILDTSNDDKEMERAVQRQDQTTNELLQMIVPDLSMESIGRIKLTRKASFMKWWNARQEEATTEQGNDQPGT